MIEESLRDLLGKRLTRVGGTFHVFEGRGSMEPVALWCAFDKGTPCRFAGASDGWRLLVDEVAPISVDMGESGSIRFQDMSMTRPFSAAMNQQVRGVWRVASPGPADTIGVRLDFDSGTIRILNWGDEMYVGSGFPADADTNEILEISVG